MGPCLRVLIPLYLSLFLSLSHFFSFLISDFLNLNANIGGTFQILNLNDSTSYEEISRFQPFHRNLILHESCPNVGSFLDDLSEKNLLNNSQRIIIYGSQNRSIDLLKRQNINVDSVVFLVDDQGRAFRVQSVELRRGTSLKVTPIGPNTNRIYDFEGNILPVAFNVSFSYYS